MADLSKLKVNGTTYDLKDAKAREDVSALKEDLKSAVNKIQECELVYETIPNSYVTTSGVITAFNGWSRTDYIDIEGYKYLSVTAKGGNLNAYNCFFNKNKQFIIDFTTEKANVERIFKIPDNAKYMMLSNATSYIKDYVIKLHPTYKHADKVIAEITTEKSDVYNTKTSGIVAYSTNGYIQTSDGAFVANNSYKVYYFTMPKKTTVWFDHPQDWTEIAVYNGTIFDTTKVVDLKTSISNAVHMKLPTEDVPLTIDYGMTVAICVLKDNSFVLHVGKGKYAVGKDGIMPKVIVSPYYSTTFYVDVLDEASGKYLRHWFYRNTYSKTLTYGNGQTKNVLCGDIWHSNYINDEEGNLLLQGNTNFIHYLDIQGHTGHVGAGHGCVVQDFTQFFADGEEFDPATLNHSIECNNFKFVTRAKHYLIDTANTQSSSEAVPTLDENGDPIVTSIWTFCGEWSANNRIKMRNQLKFVYDGVRFVQCHAGMLCGFYPKTTDVILQGSHYYTWNSTDGTNNTLEGSTDELLVEGGLTSVPADTAVLYGDTYIARQRIEQSDPTMYGKNNILANMPPNGDSRIKMYLQPCVCTSSTALTDKGETVDVFNNGDYIDVSMTRSIDLKM